MNPQKIKEVLRDPQLILSLAYWEDGDGKECHSERASQMHSDICVALEADPGNAPAADDAKRDMGAHAAALTECGKATSILRHSCLGSVAGLRYERLLNEQLEAQGLFFWTEDALRAKGYFKTPDAKLQVCGA